MITDKQFDDAFTSAGGWFLLTQYEQISSWKGDTKDLIGLLYKLGFDKDRTGTGTRVSSTIRILHNARGEEALMKIRNSQKINKQHPDAKLLATELLNKYFSHQK